MTHHEAEGQSGDGGEPAGGSWTKQNCPLRSYRQYIRCFFFFQAEDGIRDLTVTGVQTCALPIYSGLRYRMPVGKARRRDLLFQAAIGCIVRPDPFAPKPAGANRRRLPAVPIVDRKSVV